MDDLSGLDWNSSNNSTSRPQSTTNPTLSYPSLRPSPSPSNSGRSTPLTLQNLNNATRAPKPVSKPTTPANDSFASLLSVGANKQQNNLSLQERQKQLLEEKARQEAERRKKLEAQYGTQHGTFWDGLGQHKSGASSDTSTPGIRSGSPTAAHGLSSAINKPFASINGVTNRITTQSPDEDELLAGFHSSTPVDASSHYPPPQNASSGRSTPANIPTASQARLSAPAPSNEGFGFAEDDDPFGLGQMSQKLPPPAAAAAAPQYTQGDDDDILGMLGKPVSELPQPSAAQQQSSQLPEESSDQDEDGPFGPRDKAIAELVDMGFPTDKSANALAQTDTGINVQAAVGILLNQAHEESRQKLRGPQDQAQRTSSNGPDTKRSRRPQGEAKGDPSIPAWMREEDEMARASSRSKDSRSPPPEKDVSQYAQDIGTTLFKSANSLWKTSQKKVQRAVADFQQDSDSSQPKWMREAQLQEAAERRARDRPGPDQDIRKGKAPQRDVTDEAMMLEAGAGRPQKSNRQTSGRPAESGLFDERPRTQSPSNNIFQDRSSPQPRFESKAPQQPPSRAAQRLTRQDVEVQAADVIVSSRRRRPAPTSDTPPLSAPPSNTPSHGPMASPPIQSKNPFANRSQQTTPVPAPRPASVPLPTRPKAPPRRIPPVSASTLLVSASHRQNGSEAFKRGDYSTAHTHYTSALQGLPTSHPVTILIYCNRALTNIKVGDPKAAVADAESALSTIGVSRGEGEKIAVGGIEGDKDMKEFYGKAVMRKAEALENMEKWSDAAKIWREAVEAGVGGSLSIQGRNRCEKASGGGSQQSSARPSPAPRPAAARKPPPKPTSALADLSGRPQVQHAASAEAVKKLREANAAAEKADDEKFALTDQVDAKLIAWKGTKADNLRALLGSMDKVLWPEAGWTKVGMQDLVMPNRVKIIYMKAIAKVHPDKISQTATTEQRMISAAVFSTLNEAWDKFKKENGL